MQTTSRRQYYIIDFDSTLTRVEALDILAEISLDKDPDKAEKLNSIKAVTEQGMAGNLGLKESIRQRIEILDADKEDIQALIPRLIDNISSSFLRNREFFTSHQDQIYIISNGFVDFIKPVVESLGIKTEHVFANEFIYDDAGKITGFRDDNILCSNQGKAEQIKRLDLDGDIFVIGDGYTDYEIKAAGLANRFYAFTENVDRPAVSAMADHITPSLDEFLFVHQMNKALSYPKNRIKVLLLEGIHEKAFQAFDEEGYQVKRLSGSLSEEELIEAIKDVSVLGIRSKTQLTKNVLQHAKRLIAVGTFCIGTNQVDLNECLRKGIAVFNAPFSNTRSVVELVIGEIIMLSRSIFEKSMAAHEGRWHKSAEGSVEIRGKKLGIVGYGNIGAQLSVLAEAMGMDVYFYDVEEKLALGNATKCDSLDALLGIADYITLHVDGRPENGNIMGKAEFAKMKQGAIFINLSRGHIVDLEALKASLESGHIRSAAIDVFPEEPANNSQSLTTPLRGLHQTILTPHIGGSTLEAQESIADFVPRKIMDYINTGSTSLSVNFPNLQLPILKNAHRLIHIHLNMPGVMAEINKTLAAHEINIVGQYLKTNESIGYVITDIDKAYSGEIITALKAIQHTIRFRVLY